MLDIPSIRQQFPIINDGLIYLDSAATSQKPQCVLDAMTKYYEEQNANAHRSMYPLAEEATNLFEGARSTVKDFIGAQYAEEVIFTKSCTESINLIARTFGESFTENDTIVITHLEHHSNIVPWQQLSERTGVQTEWIPLTENGELDLDALDSILDQSNVKLVCVTGQSNVTGVRTPLDAIIEKAHTANAKVLVDAAQLIAHHEVNVQDLDCDFLAFSGHKVFGPTGIGVLYGKKEILNSMPPFLGGGGMISRVTTDGFSTEDLPAKFEPGSPAIAEAVGLASALDWLSEFSWQDIEKHESDLINLATSLLSKIPGLQFLGTPIPNSPSPNSCLCFTIPNIHPHDLTHLLGEKGICMRAGHHCCQPLHDALGIAASTRLSVSLYNTEEEIEKLPDAILEIIKTLNP